MAENSLFDSLTKLATDIRREKGASGPIPADPETAGGKSEHPTAKIDNNGAHIHEGARAAENEKDVKDAEGPASVNNAQHKTNRTQDAVQLNIGANQTATGEDPSVEDDYKDKKYDPGTTLAARAGEEKYASAKVSELSAFCDVLGNKILADLANGKSVKSASAPATASATQNAVGAAIEKAAAAAHAGKLAQDNPAVTNQDLRDGYALAAQLGLDKAAAQQLVAESTRASIADAQLDADLFAEYWHNYLAKQANDMDAEEVPAEDTAPAGEEVPAEPPAGGPMSAEPAGAGGASLGDMLGGGADPLDQPGGAPDALSEDAALEELVAALVEMGVTPEMLEQAGGGGMPPGDEMGLVSGAPPVGDPAAGGIPPEEGLKLARAVRQYQRSGRFQVKTAAAGTSRRAVRDKMKSYVRELMGY